MKHNIFLISLLRIILAGIIILSLTSNIAFQQDSAKPRDVISDSAYTYSGWAGNPDSITVHIDDTFSEEEKDSVRAAIQRWNDAGCVPALKEIDEGPANVTVAEGDPGDGNAGEYKWLPDDDDKTTSGTVTIRNNPNPGLVETATHELGHALGLDDTDEDDNPGDAMKGTGPSNGTNGELSEHDLAEMEAAAAAITPVDTDPDEQLYAIYPPEAIIPGMASILHFNIPTYFPPETEYWVEPIANINLEITNVVLFEDILEVEVLTMPHHWSGKIYLEIHFFDDGLHTQYLGIHYISQHPVVPIDNFECPFIATVEGNTVHVQWNELHNYPFDQPLRSALMVNGNTFYKVKPSGDSPAGYYGDYTITLEPGAHELTLFVDDYQVNSASFSMDVFIEEPPPPPPVDPYFELTPNGKTNPEDWYRWITDIDGETPVPLLTNIPDEIDKVRFYFSYDPATGVWTEFWEDLDGTSNAAPGEPGSYDEDHDGWCGYLNHDMLDGQTTEIFFKAEVEGLDGIIHEVFSEISLLFTLTPPSAFQITTDGGIVIEDIFVTDQPQLSLQFDPAHDNFDYAQFQVAENLDSIYDKNISHIKQPNDYYCGPAALAMCLNYFSGLDKMNIKDPTGGLSDAALMDSLAKYCGTKPSNGTTETGMVSGANEWIKKQGGGYTVQEFKEFGEFGVKKMAQHLLHDGKQNGVSQNIISRFRLTKKSGEVMEHYMTLNSAHKTAAGYNRFDYIDPSSNAPDSKIAFDLNDNGEASNITFANGDEIVDFPYKKVELLSSMMICPIETQVTSSGGEITQGPDFPGVEIEVPGGLSGARVRAVDNNGKKHERDVLIRRVNPPVCPEDINAPLNGPPFQLPDGQPGGGTSDGPDDVFIDQWFWPIEVGIFPITYTVEYDSFEFSCEYTVTVTPYDFGDAPDPTYPTLLASDGARHIIDGVTFLGQSVDPEPDGQQNSNATGDDNDGNNDDDGVVFGEIMVGSAAQVVVTTSVAGYLQGWMDFNANGDWNDPGEQIFTDEFIHFDQTVSLNYDVPPDALPGLTFARFRFSTQPGIGHSGLAPDGEVEDYQVGIFEDIEPPTADLIPNGKTNPDPWYRWISDPDGVTPVLLLTDAPDEIDKVSFYYSDDETLTDWTLFWEDENGDSNSAPGGPGSESDDHDGWRGYLYHEDLVQDPAELFFKAEAETSTGLTFDVLSEFSLFYTLTPPNAFLITTSEGHVIEKEYVTDQFPLALYFTPQHENFDYAQVQQSEDLPQIYDKEIPQIEQPNNYYCGPASLAMCLKYFANANETLYGHVTGELGDTALMDSLANRCGTVSPTGTTRSGMVSGVTKWIDKQGGGFTVQEFKNFSEFGKDSLVKHLLHDGLQNNVSQNIISSFMLIKYNEVTQQDDTLYHYMTLSSVHEKDSVYKRFDYADPMIPPGVGRLAFDLDDEGVASDFKFHDGGEIENFPYKKVQLLSSMMICPNEPSIVPDEGETTEGPEFSPTESDIPEGSSRATRIRAVDNDGNKHETDIILRHAPTPICQDEIILPLGGPPHELDGCTPEGGTFDGPNITDGWFIPIEEGTFTITYTVTFYGFETSCEFYVTVYALDFGDAPDEFYPTLLASDGARHGISSNLYLGQLVDPEPDGQPCPFALGDDQDGTDDEDGVRFLHSFVPGETVTVEFTVHGTGYINAWIDWEINGNWDGPGDHVIQNFYVTPGVHQHDIVVPAYAAPGFTFARFRISSLTDLEYFGQALDGEVEDYRIRINEPMGHKMHYPQYPDPAGWDVRLPEIELITDIADDWMCTESGYVEDIYFWISWNGDAVPQDFNVDFDIRIYDDIPVSESPTEYSMPGNMLWQQLFNPGSYTYEFVFEHPQGWFNPFVPEAVHVPWDHLNCYRIDIVDIPEPFEQAEGIVYWLVISANVPDPDLQAGWKTSPDHFNDIAVWFNTSIAHGWQPLFDPITQEALSLAFVINGSPAPPTHNLIVVAEPTYAGVVLGGGSFPGGEIVPVDATANEGYVFVEWTDDDGNTVSNAASFDYLMPGHDVTLTANFVEQLIPVNLVLTDEEFVAGDEVCYEALESITVSNTVVESGASVELVAGELISILPDTHIETGAVFNARIDEDGSFCGDLKAIVAIEEFITMDEERTIPTLGKMDSFFKVYPNPTDGIFTLELLTDVDEGSIQVEIFALHGTRVLHQQLPPQQLNVVDLTHFQPGMYIIRVSVGDHSGFERLIKKQR